jgi:NO-binding membrane sensor protein with MHYT domain
MGLDLTLILLGIAIQHSLFTLNYVLTTKDAFLQVDNDIQHQALLLSVGVSVIHFRCTALLEKSALVAYQMPTHSFSVTTIRERPTQDMEPK